MRFNLKTKILLIFLVAILAGCTHCRGLRDPEELGPPLLRLTSAVQGVAERPDVYGLKPGASGEECLNLGLEDDPSLIAPFEGYTVKIKCESGNAEVLVCDPGGKKALFEDVGCTSGAVDYRADNANRECDFLISVGDVCK